ncbi:FCH domain only 2 isoform X1 [Brachionus plicatilis]|uniref:FCH domain only 2 isoform X1 n=1 Tax=Brachionus plicatilis TaxID=10195 RepID=A0A3M7P862_BRAPC|nr:FCH domain only 2 isoform X1 [Brachionus plicatilis]
MSDVDSEGYSLRPDSSIDLRRRTNDDMNNYVSSASSSDTESDSDEQPVKVMLKIKPKHEQSSVQNMEVLREISKNLQLQKPPSKVSRQQQQQHSKTYQYTLSGEAGMTRSVSMGSSLQADLNKSESSLFDSDFSPKAKAANENSLYNIDEDKEVESSFEYNLAVKKAAVSSSPAGRFTPACFPGRTTPDFRHTTSLFEQQSTRASIISPLTVNAGAEIIPIAIAFTETIHAYFKIGEPARSKIKCFGCMKISFPYAILKLLSLELPLLQFNLKNLRILNQDLKLNTQLLEKDDALFADMDEFNFRFKSQHLVSELKAQHQVNKMAAFFNFELLKYEFRYLKEEAPMVLEAKWSCDRDQQTVELGLEYRLTCAKSLAQCSFMVLMPEVVVVGTKQFKVSLEWSEPRALVNRQEKEERTQVLFQVGCVSVDGKVGAKFRVSEPSGHKLDSLEQLYQPVYTKFHIDNETLSTVKFRISSGNYKLSLLKERVESGKYFCDYDPQQSASVQKGASRSQITAGSISTLIGSTVDLLN